MSAIRVRTSGNNPETRIFCDEGCGVLPVSDWDAREARKRARGLGWARRNGRDVCPAHTTLEQPPHSDGLDCYGSPLLIGELCGLCERAATRATLDEFRRLQAEASS